MTAPYAWPEIDRTRLRDHRTERLARWMADIGVDHLLLTGPDQIRYATDFRAQLISEGYDWYAAIVDSDGSFDLFVPYVDVDVPNPDPELTGLRALHPLPSWAPAACHPQRWAQALAGELRRRGARHVAYDVLDAGVMHDLAAELPSVTLRPAARDLFVLRAVKHPLEVVLIEAACQVNAAALNAAVAAARPGMRDHDLLAVAADHQHRAGVEYLTHSVCNVRNTTGNWFAVGNVLREGEPFFLDVGCHGPGGYASDAARTGFLGTPPPAVERAWNRLLEAHEVGQAAVRPGVPASRVHEAINACLAGHGLAPTPYGTGHGIGLRCCEPPAIHAAHQLDHDAVLEEGHVIALEPETTVEIDGRVFVLKIEDNFAVEAHGVRLLTSSPAGPSLGG